MNKFTRFGRRLAVPSMVQIRHELRAFSAQEEIRLECAQAAGLAANASWEEIYTQRSAAEAARASVSLPGEPNA